MEEGRTNSTPETPRPPIRICEIAGEVMRFAEDIKKECSACAELASIRATLLVNFGEEKSNIADYGFLIKDEGDTHKLLMDVLMNLATERNRATIDIPPGFLGAVSLDGHALKIGDCVQLTDDTYTVVKGQMGILIRHTGGFCEAGKIARVTHRDGKEFK